MAVKIIKTAALKTGRGCPGAGQPLYTVMSVCDY
jgi:hypothetical protein